MTIEMEKVLIFAVLLMLTVKTQTQEVSVCPTREITANSGNVKSPSEDPDQVDGEETYERGVDCTLVINTDPGMVFKVNLNLLSIETNQDDAALCGGDYLVIDTGAEKIHRCGKLPSNEPEHKTISNKLVIRFRSNDGDHPRLLDKGFKLSFATEKSQVKLDGESMCPSRHIKKKRSGTIFSPGFPGYYGNNLDCKIRIPIPDNFQLNVWFSDFALKRSSSCRSDRLSIRDEHGGTRMCGGGGGPNQLPGFQQYKASLATFHFKTDDSLVNTGFRLHYNMTRLTEGRCMCSTGSSYMCVSNFNSKVRRVWHRIKFSVKTSQKSGLIVYSHKGSYRDYMYIAIQDGRMYYKSDLGTGPSIAVSHGMAINDGKWHYVEIRRRKRSLTIAVDNGKAKGSTKTKGNFNRIDLQKSVGYILGTPPQLQGMPNFIGCIRDFTIDGREPLTNVYVAKPDYHGHRIGDMKKC